ncbi:MAG: hypothetical protein ACOYEV_16420 [Candidatus Nanopelagicales bacterium]
MGRGRCDGGAVLVEGDVAAPVQAVLDVPVALDPAGQDIGFGLVLPATQDDHVDDIGLDDDFRRWRQSW